MFEYVRVLCFSTYLFFYGQSSVFDDPDFTVQEFLYLFSLMITTKITYVGEESNKYLICDKIMTSIQY